MKLEKTIPRLLSAPLIVAKCSVAMKIKKEVVDVFHGNMFYNAERTFN